MTTLTMNLSVNPNSAKLAEALADGKLGTFSGIVIRKQGKTAGRGADKKTYGDDLVHAAIVTGFKYDTLKERDGVIMATLTAAGLAAEEGAKALKDGKGNPVTEADFAAALAEMVASAEKSAEGTNTATHDHVYEPLVVDGTTVRGASVYVCVAGNPDHECKCRGCTGDAKAPESGTIYIAGLKVGETVLEVAANGPAPATKSAAKTVAKGYIRRKLPSRRYVRYRLEPGSDFILRVGGTAAVAANKDGIELREAAVAEVLRVA